MLCSVLATPEVLHAAVFRVDAAASGANNGASWTDAFTTIQAGIDAARAAAGGEVWVKAGVYSGCNSDPVNDSFEARDPNSVDLIGEERELCYQSSGASRYAHLTLLYLTGDVTVEPPAASLGGTSELDPLAVRLAALVQTNPDLLVFANHPSRTSGAGAGDTRISREDLAAAVNANGLHGMEIKNPEDAGKWDYVLANLDDQAGDCRKILWGLRADDQHYAGGICAGGGAMMGTIPTAQQDPVYTDRRVGLRDMIRRGSTVSLPPNARCGMPTYTLNSSGGSAGAFGISLFVGNATSAQLRFYGCEWATGVAPGALLYQAPVSVNSTNSVSYYLTQNGRADGVPLTNEQKANIKYIRPVLQMTFSWGETGQTYLQPVRIRSDGNWWNGPAYTLAGGQGSIGPSPYPSGGTDTGETIYFNTHCHSLMSDGDATPQTMRRKYWAAYGEFDPTKPRFTVITDHNTRTPFVPPTRSVVVLKEGVELYGGFAGTETVRDQRKPDLNATVIDAQQAGRGVYSCGTDWGVKTNAMLDGFVIRYGKVGGNAAGGGMYNWECSPTISNCTFVNNQAVIGGGLCNSSSSPSITNCTFSYNSAGTTPPWRPGGGMFNECYSSPRVTNCSFEYNSARKGGGMCNFMSSPLVSDCTFYMNSVNGYYSCWGGGMYNWRSSPEVTNCTFQSNTANATYGYGGGMYNESGCPAVTRCTFQDNCADGLLGGGGGISSRSASLVISSSIFAGNSARGYYGMGGAIYDRDSSSTVITNNTITSNQAFWSGGIYCYNASGTLANNIVAFNEGGIWGTGSSPVLLCNDVYGNNTDYAGINPGTSDICMDPLLANPAGRDYHLASISPCINAGRNDAPGRGARDMDDESRIYGAAVDIGADELWPALLNAKSLGDDASFNLEAAIVTAAFTGFFYVEADDRSYGIRVDKPDYSLTPGMRARVEGKIRTNGDGERYVEATTADERGSGSVKPLGMANRAIGGGDWHYEKLTGGGQRGVQNGPGLNNIGMLICTTGRVKYADTGYFYVDDGCALSAGLGPIGVKVLGSVPVGQGENPVGKYVKVTGISSCFKHGDHLDRLVRATEVVVVQ